MRIRLAPLRRDEQVLSALRDLLFGRDVAALSGWNLKVSGSPRDCASEIIGQWFDCLRDFELDAKRRPHARSYLISCPGGFRADYLDLMWEALMYWLSFDFPNNPALLAFFEGSGDLLTWKILLNAASLIPCGGLGKLYRDRLQRQFEEAAAMVLGKRLGLEGLGFDRLSLILRKPRRELERLIGREAFSGPRGPS